VTRRIADGLKVVTAFLIPLGLCALWVPVRSRLPNTDLALVLVLAVLLVGAAGRRLAVFAAGVSAAFWFDFFDTRPFEHPSIQRTTDLETTLVLAAVAIIGGELAIRIVRHRSRARSEAARLTSISGAASLLASGEELALVVAAVSGELKGLLGLESCTFEVAPHNPSRSRLNRDGELVAPRTERVGADPRSWATIEVPVWGHRHVFGHFVMEFGRDAQRPTHGDLVAAMALGDQVGAAFMTQAPTPPDPVDEPTPNLRVVR
jgi:K+-sensing histidine kinase KdpD